MLHLTHEIDGGMVSEGFGGPPLDRPISGARGDDNAVVLLDVYANWKLVEGGDAWLKSMWSQVKAAAQWQLAQAMEFGVMGGLTNTYDEAPHMGSVNAWNAFLHLAAVKAARANDTVFAAECNDAMVAARNATMDLLWDAAHTRFRGYWCNVSGAAVVNTDNVMADALVGVLWAEGKFRSHLPSRCDFEVSRNLP